MHEDGPFSCRFFGADGGDAFCRFILCSAFRQLLSAAIPPSDGPFAARAATFEAPEHLLLPHRDATNWLYVAHATCHSIKFRHSLLVESVLASTAAGMPRPAMTSLISAAEDEARAAFRLRLG